MTGIPYPSFKNFLSLHGRLFGLFRLGVSPGDCWIGGDQFQGVLSGVSLGQATTSSNSSQAAGFAITTAVVQFTTVASGSYGVLPPAVQGMEIEVINDGSNALQVCGSAATGDTIDGVATATGVAVSNARRSRFRALNTALAASGASAATVGQWVSMGMPKST